MYILFAILIFSILIVLHELGHFLTAKLFHIRVNEFSVFMGPKLFQWKGKETAYTLRCIPFGGYCAMEGEDSESEDPRAFTSAAVWKRAIVLIAGSFMNFLTGLVIVLVIFSRAQSFSQPVISDFFDNCPYEGEDAFQVGDRIISIDGYRVRLVEDVGLLLSRGNGEDHTIVVRRDGRNITLQNFHIPLVTYNIDGVEQQKYGFYFSAKEATLGAHIQNSWNRCMYFSRMVWMGLSDLIHGKVGLKDMSGPVGIVAVISETGENAESVSAGIIDTLYLAAFIAVNLAIMNMLPLPALDGGRVFCLLITALIVLITGKKIDPKYEGYIHTAGIILLILLMVVIFVQDIIRLF